MAATNFKKCKVCGEIFNFMGKPICPQCTQKMDEDFAKVRKYIYENPNARVEEIAEETEVDPKMIMQFLREGRLELRTASAALTCEKCGTPISTGRLCKDCMKGINSTIQGVLPQKEKKKPIPVDPTKKSKLHVSISKGKED